MENSKSNRYASIVRYIGLDVAYKMTALFRIEQFDYCWLDLRYTVYRSAALPRDQHRLRDTNVHACLDVIFDALFSFFNVELM